MMPSHGTVLNSLLPSHPFCHSFCPLHLQVVDEHESVEQSRRAQAEPINLDSCLRAFTSEEELGENEMYYCSKCKTHCLATKKLDLWRLPPILVCYSPTSESTGAWHKGRKSCTNRNFMTLENKKTFPVTVFKTLWLCKVYVLRPD